MKNNELKSYLIELLIEDNDNLSDQRLNIYVNGIIEELQTWKIAYKYVNEINLHEFNTRYGYLLTVRVIYNGDFEHNFTVYGSPERKFNKK